MIRVLTGEVLETGENFFTVSCNGIGFKVMTNGQTLARVQEGAKIRVYTTLFIREDHLELFGFLDTQTLSFFELVTTVSGVGPKTGLNILELDTVPRIMAAIVERRVDLLTRVSGIGKKTSERLILELQDKIKMAQTEAIAAAGGVDAEVEAVLVGLGVQRSDAREVLQKIEEGVTGFEDRLKMALRTLGRNQNGK